MPWNSVNRYTGASGKSFIFLVKDDKSVLKFKNASASHEIYDGADYGPMFGIGHDFVVRDNCNHPAVANYSNLGNAYEKVDNIQHLDNGCRHFTVDEIEVFQVSE